MLKYLKSMAAVAILAVTPQIAMSQDPIEKVDRVDKLPLTTSPYASVPAYKPLTIPQQRARFAAEQRMLRLEWNEWIGYSPLRPNMNASYLSNGMQRYYIPSRGVIVSAGRTSSWYW